MKLEDALVEHKPSPGAGNATAMLIARMAAARPPPAYQPVQPFAGC